jgi:hypothetical protein
MSRDLLNVTGVLPRLLHTGGTSTLIFPPILREVGVATRGVGNPNFDSPRLHTPRGGKPSIVITIYIGARSRPPIRSAEPILSLRIVAQRFLLIDRSSLRRHCLEERHGQVL